MILSIIIVNYNVYDLLKNCIQSIYTIVKNVEFEIIVVDNNSPLRDIENIVVDYPNVLFVKLFENVGFAKANNLAFHKSSGQYILLLNPDTILIEDFVTGIINLLDRNDSVSAYAPMLLNQDGTYQSSTGPRIDLFYDILESFYLTGLYRKLSERKFKRNLYDEFTVDWVSSACIILKREDFNNVSGFSETYFLNYEDIDLCMKIKALGKKVVYLPRYKCIHLIHRSFSERYDKLVLSRYKSKLLYFKLHYSVIIQQLSRVVNVSGLLVKYFFSYFIYKGSERKLRQIGYFESLKLFLKSGNNKRSYAVTDIKSF